MWQGKVVDKVIELEIIPKIKDKQQPDFEAIADKAVETAKKQFTFSEVQEYKFNAKTGNQYYCILDIHEVQKPYKQEELEAVYDNIRLSILNFPKIMMPKGDITLLDFLSKPGKLVPNQDRLSFNNENITIKPQIDLLFYYKDNVIIIDWKLHESELASAERQLSFYGLTVLLNSQKSSSWKTYNYEKIHLLEVNLLGAEVRKHEFTSSSANDTLDYIYLTNEDIVLTFGEKKWDKIDPNQIMKTENENTCKFCNFRTMCSFCILNKKNDFNETEYYQFVQDYKFA
jgi:hypothetical protein